MKRNKIYIQSLLILMALISVVGTGCNKALIIEPDACFTANRIDSLGEYVVADEFLEGEEIHFVSCGVALFEVIYTGRKEILKELTGPDGSDSIVWNYNSYYPDKNSPELENYFDKKGKPLSITGLPLEQAGEFREASYKYSDEGEYEVYLEAINRNEEGITSRATSMKLIKIIAEE